MAIALIYHPEERELAEQWAQKIEQMGYETVLAALGMPIGSESWKSRVKSDLEQSEAALLLLTTKSSEDRSVKWRANVVMEKGKPLLPILIGENVQTPRWINLQCLLVRDTDTRAQEYLLEELRRICPLRPFCFISYSRSGANIAKRLREDLCNLGATAWRDEDDIPAGSSWDSEIQKALTKSTYVLFVATPHSVVSPNALDELNFAADMRRIIIPIIVEDCQLPLRIHRSQWVDFRSGYERGLSELIRHLGLKTEDSRAIP